MVFALKCMSHGVSHALRFAAWVALQSFRETELEINADLAAQALEQALAQFPQFEIYGPKIEWRPLMQGGAFVVSYDEHPPREMPHTWDFQNAFAKGYKRLAGVS